MDKIKLLALFGESSTGKDSIQRWLCQNFDNIHGIISYTTRPPRDYEKDGQDYYFISDEKFSQLLAEDKLLETTTFNNWFYGTSIDELKSNKINIGVFNPTGIRNLLNKSDIISTLPVWIQTSEKERLLRSLNREKNPNCTEICRRFLTDKEDFANIDFKYEIFLNNKKKDNYYSFITNPKIFHFIQGQN